MVFIVPLKTKQIAFRGLMCVKEIIQFVDFVTQVRFCNNMTLSENTDNPYFCGYVICIFNDLQSIKPGEIAYNKRNNTIKA